jgi:ribosomal protein S18 acetylase RimI-like enzyme
MQIRAARADDVDACVGVLAALPDYFTSSTHDDVRRQLPAELGWVAEDEGHVVGFLLAPRRFQHAAEITFAAVIPHRRNQGIGRALVESALAALASNGVVMVEVKTLDASANYEPYVATRAFWKRCGFVQIDCIDPLPGWEPGNPAAIYAQAVHPTRGKLTGC